jgi:hypothetical protein
MAKIFEYIGKSQSGNGVRIRDPVSKKEFWVPRGGCILTDDTHIEVEEWVKKPYMPAKPKAPDFVYIPIEYITVKKETEKALILEFQGADYVMAKSLITQAPDEAGVQSWKVAGWAWEKKKPAEANDKTVTFEGEVMKTSEKGILIKILATGEESWFAVSLVDENGDGTFTMPEWAYEKRTSVRRP